MQTTITSIFVKEGKVLLERRRKDEDNYANCWALPGGHIEKDETAEHALIREMKEEFDIDVVIGGLFGESTYRYETETVQLLAYHTTWNGGDFSLKVHAAIRWVSLIQLHKYEFAPADKPFVEKLQQSMTTI